MNTPDTTIAVEYRADAAKGTITLHLNGEPAPYVGQPDVRGVRNRTLRTAILAALDRAMRDGARYGEIDPRKECAASLNGEHLPGRYYYASVPHEDGWAVTRQESHREPEVIITGGKPYYTRGDVVNALDRAFKVGGRYGHPAVDRIARPLHVPATGAIVTAVEISRHRPLLHSPARGHQCASTLFGAQVLLRATTQDKPDVYAYFRRYDGGSYAPDGRQISPPDNRVHWQMVSEEVPADVLLTWDLQDPAARYGEPNPRLAAWLDTVVDLAPAPPPASNTPRR